MTSSVHSHTGNKKHSLNQPSMEKVSKKVMGVSNPQTDTFRTSYTERHLQNFEKVETIVDELQERFNHKIKGWNRNILVEMAWLHIDKRNGFNAATIRLLERRLKNNGIRIKDKVIKYNNLRKRINLMYRKGFIKKLPDKDGHGDQYVLANMQDLCDEKDNDSSIKDSTSLSPTLKDKNDAITEEILYQAIVGREGKTDNDRVTIDEGNPPEPEFHHIKLLSHLTSPEEDYEKLEASNDWTMSSEKNRGLKYERRISRHRTFTIIVYPVGTVEIMLRCTKDPFRWYPREDWIVLYDICSFILNLLREYLGWGISSNPLVHSSYLEWWVTQLHLGYDIQVTGNKENRKGKKTLDLTKFGIPIMVKNLDGISCQVYTKRMPNKGTTLRLEEHINFSTKSFDSDLQNVISTRIPSPSLQSLKNTITPKSIETILDNVYSR